MVVIVTLPSCGHYLLARTGNTVATQGLAELEKQLEGLQQLVGRRVVMHSHKEPGLDGSDGMVEDFDSSTRMFTVKLDKTNLSVPPEVRRHVSTRFHTNFHSPP